QHYAEAIATLKQSVETSTDPEVVGQARTEIAQIVRTQLSTAELEQLADQYATTYPGDLILLQLAQQYREKGVEDKEIDVLPRRTANFPQHPEAQAVQARLQELQPSAATSPIKIGVLLPLSGNGGFYGQRALQGIELALAVLQERSPNLHITL